MRSPGSLFIDVAMVLAVATGAKMANHDLNVIGCAVDEALSRTEQYLDQAVLHTRRHVRIIHGHGTGVLRRSIAGLLETHPQVARFAPAQREQGGTGVTVVDLKD